MVPVRIVNMNDAQALEAQLVENLIRADVYPMEEAQGFNDSETVRLFYKQPIWMQLEVQATQQMYLRWGAHALTASFASTDGSTPSDSTPQALTVYANSPDLQLSLSQPSVSVSYGSTSQATTLQI
jgi:hypothetical protein